jgi:hypothetical protein
MKRYEIDDDSLEAIIWRAKRYGEPVRALNANRAARDRAILIRRADTRGRGGASMMVNRLVVERAGLALLLWHSRTELRANRSKGVPTETPERLLRLAQDEVDEALHAIRSGCGLSEVLSEIGDAGAYLALAAWASTKETRIHR